MENISENNLNSDSESEEECENIINILVEADRTNIIPEKSKRLYELQYEKFKNWCNQIKIKKIDDKVTLAYFETLSKSYKATSLWAIYSRLRPMILLKENIDISKHLELQCFLKSREKVHKSKKSKVFTKEEVSTFLTTAPDDEFLLQKVVLVIGLNGCLRGVELLNITINDIQKQGDLYHISIPKTKTGIEKSFITNQESSPIITKYMELRPEGIDRFFLQYRNKKCIRQHVGKNKISSIPKDIAKFLNLSDPELYTGHAFRRTSAKLLADEGADLLALKRHEEWKSNTVAEGYINKSIKIKMDASRLISNSIHNKTVFSKRPEKMTQSETDELQSITQEKLKEITTSNFSPRKKQKKTNSEIKEQLIDVITQEEIQKIVNTDFLDNTTKKNKNVNIFKNCTVNIYQK